MVLDGVLTIGLWTDIDGPEIRAALRTLGHADLPVRYLDGDDIPMRYKARLAGSEPVAPNSGNTSNS